MYFHCKLFLSPAVLIPVICCSASYPAVLCFYRLARVVPCSISPFMVSRHHFAYHFHMSLTTCPFLWISMFLSAAQIAQIGCCPFVLGLCTQFFCMMESHLFAATHVPCSIENPVASKRACSLRRIHTTVQSCRARTPIQCAR